MIELVVIFTFFTVVLTRFAVWIAQLEDAIDTFVYWDQVAR